jgi:FkbM family methyltransferase
MKVDSNLIYDVGLFDGADTAYYLFRGYNVVAIDANPVMVDKARLRFAREIQAGRLTLLNVGVSRDSGTMEFWVSDVPEWSSFDRSIASRDGTRHSAVAVATAPFGQILEQYGVPHYLKIDIEGNDRLCVDALKGTTIPKYISVESECVGDSGVLTDEEATAMLVLLKEIGYRRFKLVNQWSGWTSVRSNGAAQLGLRLARKVARLKIRGLSSIADRFTDSRKTAGLGFEFPFGSSGPWGEDVAGGWMTFEQARATYLRERHAFFARKQASYSFWYDWHATY